MNYNFKGVFPSGKELSIANFRHMLSFTRAYNNCLNRGIKGEANVLRELIGQGFSDAASLNQIVKKLTNGHIPTIADEHEFLGEYYNYTQEMLTEAKNKQKELEERYKNEKLFTALDDKQYSAEEVMEQGRLANKKSRLPKFLRFGAVALGVIVGAVAPVLLAGIVGPYIAASVVATTIFNVAGIVAPIVGGIIGKRLFDRTEMAQKLKANEALAKLYKDKETRDLIKEQEKAIEREKANVSELNNKFGIELDGQGNETHNAYNDLYNAYARSRANSQNNAANNQNNAGQAGNNAGQNNNQTTTGSAPVSRNLDPSFGKNMTQEDIDAFIEEAFKASQNNAERVVITPENIDAIVDEMLGGKPEPKQPTITSDEPITEPAETEPEEEPERASLADWVKEEAKDYASYIESKRLSGIVPQAQVAKFKNYVDNSLNTVLDENADESDRMGAYYDLKYTYADTIHKLNMQKLEPVVRQFEAYKKADKEFEDGTFDMLISKIGEIKDGFETTTEATNEELDAQIERLKFEKGLVDIAQTYGWLVDTQTLLKDSSQLNLEQKDVRDEKYAAEEQLKGMKIIAENACYNFETAEELEALIQTERYEQDKKKKVPVVYDYKKDGEEYLTEKSYAERANKKVRGSIIKQKQAPKEEVKKEEPVVALVPVEQNKKPTPQEVADEIVKREQQEREQKAKLKALYEQQEAERIAKENAEKEAKEAERLAAEKAAEEERKARRRANMARTKALFEAEPTQEELDELHAENNANLPPQMRSVFNTIEAQKSKDSEPASKQPKAPRMVTDLYREEKLKDLQDAVKNNQKFANAGGRYLISIVSKDALDFMRTAKTAEELDERCDKAKKFVDVIVDKYRLYTDIDILNKKNKNKVRSLREINAEDEKDGITKGEKCNTTVVKGFSGVEAQAHYDAVLESYMEDFDKSCKGAKDLTDATSAQINKQVKKYKEQYKQQIQEAIANGEHPLTAIDNVMIKAYNGLSAFITKNMHKIDSVEEQEM